MTTMSLHHSNSYLLPELLTGISYIHCTRNGERVKRGISQLTGVLAASRVLRWVSSSLVSGNFTRTCSQYACTSDKLIDP